MPVFAWDGYDWDKGSYVNIGKGNLVRRGREIEVYDYEDAEYKYYEVESIRRTPSNRVELELYDYDTDEYRTLDMDG